MSRASVTILYEDRRGQTQGFGLHALVKACVYDAIDGDRRWLDGEALRDYRPLKGDGNLLRACREDLDLIAADGRTVVAVFDSDKIRTLLKLSPKAKDADVEKEIRKGARSAARLSIILLEDNTESVILAAAQCDPTLEKARVERAALEKNLLERDAILMELSRERARPARDCILREMP